MPVRRIDHILIAMPAGRENDARAFYCGVLGITEKMKPPVLAARGGCWFEIGALQVHLGVENNVTADEPLEGCDRRHIDDPFGNRIELIEPNQTNG